MEKCELFKGISPSHIPELLECLNAYVGKYLKNEVIIQEGLICNRFGVVLKGTVMVVKEKADGSRVLLNVFEPGEMFGDIAAFSTLTNIWPSTIIANTDAIVMFLNTENISNMCFNACPSHRMIIKNLLTYISDRGFKLIKRVECLTIKSLTSKLATFLLDQYKTNKKDSFILPFNRNQMAEYLGVTRPALSKEMSELKKRGIIEYYKSSVKILDMQKLIQCELE